MKGRVRVRKDLILSLHANKGQYMRKYNILQKIITMVIILTMFDGMVVFAETETETSTTDYITISSIENSDGMTIDDVSFLCGQAVVTGGCDGRYGELITYTVYDANDKTKILSIGETKNKQDFTYSINIGLKPEDTLRTILVEVKGASKTQKATAVFTMYSPEVEFDSMLKETEALLIECEEKGISTDYERVNYQAAVKIKNMFQTYAKYNETEAYEYNLNEAMVLCDEAKTALQSYIAGMKLPKTVVRTVTGVPDVSGESFIADTVSSDGKSEKRPVFYVGYGHWENDDMEDYRAMGVNLIQYEIGPEHILKKASDEEIAAGKLFTVDTEKLKEVREVFERAEDCGVSIVFLTAMHYFPEFLYEYDPTIINGGKVSDFPNFTPYNPTHPVVLDTFNQFLDAIIPVIRDYKSLNSICISNEPIFTANKTSDYYIEEYQRQLKEKYVDIKTLNAAHGTNYNDFTEITMPQDTSEGSSEREPLAAFNDYRLFNESIVTAYQKAISDKIKSIDENIKVHTKGMAYIQSKGRSNNRLELGLNHEEISKFVDINGCDSWAYYGKETDTLQGKTMWYDYMTSVMEAPVSNSEDHILTGSEMSRSDAELDYNMADVWQGAVHGRGSTALWLWDDTKKSVLGSDYYNSNLTRRVDYIAGIGKVALDLNRLAYEVTAIQEADARVGILYSDSSLVLNPYSLQATYKVYEKAMAYGEKVFFVNESNPEALCEQKLEILIVPCCNYIKEETLLEMKQFLDNGGRILLLNANGKGYYDENGNAHDSTLLNNVTSRSEKVSFYKGNGITIHDNWNTVSNKLKSVFSEFSHPVELVAANGATEWLSAKYGGDYIVNLCNYGDSDTQITLNTELGYDVSSAVDLISGERVGESFIVSPHQPMLLKIKGINGFTFYNNDENGTMESKLWIRINGETNVGAGAVKMTDGVLEATNGASCTKIEAVGDGWYKVYSPTKNTHKIGWTNMPFLLVTGSGEVDFYIDNLSIIDADGNEMITNGGFEYNGTARKNNIISEFGNTEEIKGLTYCDTLGYNSESSVRYRKAVDENTAGTNLSMAENLGMTEGESYSYSFYFKPVPKTKTSQIIGRGITVKAKYMDGNADYVHITAVYENDVLKQIFMHEGGADLNGVINSEQSFEIAEDIDISKCTVKSFLLSGIDKLTPYIPAEEISGE